MCSNWFKMYHRDATAISACSDEVVGKCLKAVLKFAETGEERIPDGDGAKILYSIWKKNVLEAEEACAKKVADGRAGAEKRWGKTEDE